MEDKRQKDRRTSVPQQDQPEAEISLVHTEQDDLTTPPPIDKLATTASLKEKDNKILKEITTWVLKLQGKRTWLTDTYYHKLSQYSVQGRTKSRAKPVVLVVLDTRI